MIRLCMGRGVVVAGIEPSLLLKEEEEREGCMDT